MSPAVSRIEYEGGAAAFRAAQLDPAVVAFGDRLDDGQAESGAAGAGAAAGGAAPESLEDHLGVLRLDAGPAVGDVQLDPPAVPP